MAEIYQPLYLLQQSLLKRIKLQLKIFRLCETFSWRANKMKMIKNQTSIDELNRTLEKYEEHHANVMITTDELSDILVRIIKRKMQLAKISTYRELTTYINHLYSLYMNGEISDTEYETTNIVIDDIIAKAFR